MLPWDRVLAKNICCCRFSFFFFFIVTSSLFEQLWSFALRTCSVLNFATALFNFYILANCMYVCVCALVFDFLFYFFLHFTFCAHFVCVCAVHSTSFAHLWSTSFFIVGCMALAATLTTLWWCGIHTFCTRTDAIHIHIDACLCMCTCIRMYVCIKIVHKGIFREYVRWSARTIEFIKHVIGSSYASHVSYVVCVLIKY